VLATDGFFAALFAALLIFTAIFSSLMIIAPQFAG